MALIPEASQWHKLWSIRLAILSAALSAAEVTLPMFTDIMPPGVFACLSMVVAVSAAIARTVKQNLP